MEYEKIVSVTGLPGLYELVSSKSDGAIVRSLEDKSTRFVSSRIHNFSHLESIEVYTNRDNVNLVEVFNAMEGNSETFPDEKDNNSLRKYFEKVYPDLDFERVYTSDMKKMVKWFSVLKANNIEIKLREPEEEPVEEPQPEEAEPVVDKKAEKAPKTAKTEADKKADKPVKAAKEKEPAKKAEKPAAKPAAKKEKEEKKEAPKKKAATKAAKTEQKKETPPKKKSAAKKK